MIPTSGGGGFQVTPTFIPQNDPHRLLIIVNFFDSYQGELVYPAHLTVLEITSRNQGSELSRAIMTHNGCGTVAVHCYDDPAMAVVVLLMILKIDNTPHIYLTCGVKNFPSGCPQWKHGVTFILKVSIVFEFCNKF